MLHLVLHALVPLAIALSLSEWRRPFLIMAATMLVDADHLLADPVYDAQRCSIGFHPLHEPVACVVYAALCFHPKTRWVGVGLSVHMALDLADCLM